ncbi:MAG: oligosaccharide repeat unit polymerase [Brevundimonas sp.]
MKIHPAVLMLMVWAICIVAFYLLPFQLENRVMSLYGLLILLVFIGVFCLGAVSVAGVMKQRPLSPDVAIDFRLTDRILVLACLVALAASLMDVQGRDIFSLVDSYEVRSDRAGGLLNVAASESTIWFQIAFIMTPAAYIYLIREIAFRPHPILWRVAVFGFGPIIMNSLAAGGRNPLFYALLAAGFAYLQRKFIFANRTADTKTRRRKARRPVFKLNTASRVLIGLMVIGMGIYFARVFIVRADVVGGVDTMFGITGHSWGVNFNGPLSDVLFTLLGPDLTYLVFVFSWYVVQGFVMSNTLFTSYDGPMMWSAYGIDLSSAVVRRTNSEFLAEGFGHLLSLNTYGFLPSAFGSLYVDFKFLGLLPCLAWGWAAGLVYKEIKLARDPRWRMVAPIVIIGILLSVINTPIGFSNGLVTHGWLIVAFLSARVIRKPTSPLDGGQRA